MNGVLGHDSALVTLNWAGDNLGQSEHDYIQVSYEWKLCLPFRFLIHWRVVFLTNPWLAVPVGHFIITGLCWGVVSAISL